MPRSYGIFYLTAKSLLRHCKKIVLITWLLSGKFYIFNIDSRRLQQYYEYDHCFFYSFATSWDFTYISFTYIRFYLSGSTRHSHFEIEFGKNSKTYACVFSTLPGWPTCTSSYGKFSSHLGGISVKSSETPPRQAGSLLI